jgi:glutamate/aspartate transport system substrate-binding protein
MRRMIRSGEAEAIYERWFIKPIPQSLSAANQPMRALNLPMSYLLRDWWKYPTDVVNN